MSSMLRCAVIGVGYLGRFHAQKYKLIDSAQLVGVFDQSQERCKTVAAELGVRAFNNVQEVVESVSAVTISASTESHFALAKFCLENGLHVHVEKPMTSTVEQGEELVRLAKLKNVKLQVGHVERFNAAFKAVQDKLDRPLFIECHRLAPFNPRGADVNVVLDLMIHDIDVVLSLVRDQVHSISAVGTPVLTSMIDIANARIEFVSGATANLTASRVSQQAMRKFRIFQKNTYLSLDFGGGEVKLVEKDLNSKDAMPFKTEAWNLQKSDGLLEETRSFVSSVLEDKKCVVSGEDGLVALRLAERIIGDIERRL